MKDIFNLISGPHGLILLGGIITLIGAFWSSKQDSNNEKQLNRKNEIIIEKTEKIAELNNQIVSAVTGGDSFPKLTFGIPDGIHGLPILSIEGENALSNVTGRLIDIKELRKKQKRGDFNPDSGKYFNANVISPAYVIPAINNKHYLKINESKRFLVHFYTPYNTYMQEIAIEVDTVTGFPLQAYRIYRGNKKELIHTVYPENFPIPLEDIDFREE